MAINITGYKSIKDLIDIILSGLGRLDEKYNLDKNLAVSWAIECMREIGANFYSPELIPLNLKVKGFNTTLPDNLGILEGVYYCGDKFNEDDLSFDLYYERYFALEYNDKFSERFGGDDKTNTFPFTRYSYYVNYPYIVTNFECGKISLDYRAIHTDQYGIPMYPDDPWIEKALRYYITYWWMYEPYLMTDISESKYKEIENMMTSSMSEAKVQQARPDINEAREMLNKTLHRYDKYKLPRSYNYFPNGGNYYRRP